MNCSCSDCAPSSNSDPARRTAARRALPRPGARSRGARGGGAAARSSGSAGGRRSRCVPFQREVDGGARPGQDPPPPALPGRGAPDVEGAHRARERPGVRAGTGRSAAGGRPRGDGDSRMDDARVTVIGGGLAGSEAACQLARAGVAVELVEMKPARRSPAHVLDGLAELVCSNSLRSDNPHNAVGLLHEELRRLGSLSSAAADETRVPAGTRWRSTASGSARRDARVDAAPGLRRVAREATALPAPPGLAVIATGPLTSDALAAELARARGGAAPLLRRHRADRGGRVDRHVDRVRAVPVRQGERRRLPEPPARRGAVPRLRGRPARRARRCSRTRSRSRATSRGACRSR